MPDISRKERMRRLAVIEMVLGVNAQLFELGENRDMHVVLMAVRLGNYQDRPMTALAAVTNLPRTTVIRHIKALEELGRVSVVNAGRRAIPILIGKDQPLVNLS